MNDGARPTGRTLTRSQFDAVIRRASEIAARDAQGGDGDLAEAEVYRIAGEVGLDERHVRRALAEVRGARPGSGVAGRLVGPATLTAIRVVDRAPDDLARHLDAFLVDGPMLQRVRQTPRLLHYRRSADWISQLSRAARGSAQRYHIAKARSVEVTMEPLGEGRTAVEIEVDPGLQSSHLGGGLAGAIPAGIGGGIGVGIGAATLMPQVAAVAVGAATAVAVAAGVMRLVRGGYRRRLADVRAEVEGVLDRLETGSPLDTPDHPWRKWVEKQVEGVRQAASTLMNTSREGERR